MKYFIIIFTFLFIYNQKGYSFWQQFDNIYGGCVFDFVELDDDRIFAATYKNGIYESSDIGRSWKKINFPFQNYFEDTFFSMAKDKNGDIYVASYIYGLYKYSKKGEWSKIPFDFGAIYSLLIHNSRVFTTNNLGLQYYDIDFEKWVFVEYFYLNEVYSIARNSKNMLYASANYLGNSSAIYVSSDGGDNWFLEIEIDNDIAQKIIFNKNDLLVIATLKGFVYLYDTKSKNLKELYRPQNTSQILSLYVNGDSTIIFGTKYDGMFVTKNLGGSWNKVNLPQFNEQINNFCTLKNGTLLCATLGSGIIVSSDNGDNWDISNTGFNGLIINSIIEDRDGFLYLCTEGSGIFKINKEGAIYRFSNSGLATGRIRAMDIKDSLIVIGTSGGFVYRYDNELAKWIDLKTLDAIGNINSIVIMPDFSIYVGTSNKGVLHRNIDGVWSEKNNGFDPIYGRNCLLLKRKQNLLFASISSYGLYRSDDYGENWTKTNPYPQPSTYASIEFDSSWNIFVLQSPVGIYKSLNDGDNWETVHYSPWSAFYSFNCMSISSTGKILMGTQSTGYMELDTNSRKISIYNMNLQNYTIKSICLSKSNYVFIGTDGSGVYRSIEPLTSVDEVFAGKYEFSRHINKIDELFNFNIDNNSQIIIYDLLGNLIAICEKDGVKNKTSNLSKGIYFIKIIKEKNLQMLLIWNKD